MARWRNGCRAQPTELVCHSARQSGSLLMKSSSQLSVFQRNRLNIRSRSTLTLLLRTSFTVSRPRWGGALYAAHLDKAVRYIIKADQSRLTVHAFAKGLLSAFGHSPTLVVRRLAGEVEFDAAIPDATSLRLSVPADSLAVLDNISETDRQEIERKTRQEVLEA